MALVDIRVDAGFPDHPKTKKLIRRLGAAGGWYLITLWCRVRAQKPDGNLTGWTDEDIAIAADWPGETKAFMDALIESRWVEGEPGSREMRSWVEHQSYSIEQSARQEKSSHAAKVRWERVKRDKDLTMPKHAQALPVALPNGENSHAQDAQARPGNAPIPIPIPNPEEKIKKRKRAVVANATAGHNEFIKFFTELWAAKFPKHPKYPFKDGKDGSAARNIVKYGGLEMAKQLAQVYLADAPDGGKSYWKSNGYSIAVMYSDITALVVKLPDETIQWQPIVEEGRDAEPDYRRLSQNGSGMTTAKDLMADFLPTTARKPNVSSV